MPDTGHFVLHVHIHTHTHIYEIPKLIHSQTNFCPGQLSQDHRLTFSELEVTPWRQTPHFTYEEIEAQKRACLRSHRD